MTDLFTQLPPDKPLAERKQIAIDKLAEYIQARNKVISEQYYGGKEIIDEKK